MRFLEGMIVGCALSVIGWTNIVDFVQKVVELLR